VEEYYQVINSEIIPLALTGRIKMLIKLKDLSSDMTMPDASRRSRSLQLSVIAM